MNWAVFCDLNSNNINFNTFIESILKIDGKILYTKFYGYNPNKHKDFLDYIKKTHAEMCLSQNKKKHKLDIRQCIDAVLYMTKSNVDGAILFCSEDELYMIKAIKSLNKQVIVVKSSKSQIDEYCDKVIYLSNKESTEFLPYSGVEGEVVEMKEIKQKLDLMIENKLKSRENEFTSSKELEKLLKKYF